MPSLRTSTIESILLFISKWTLPMRNSREINIKILVLSKIMLASIDTALDMKIVRKKYKMKKFPCG